MTLKIKFAWVWLGIVYQWNSTFPNHLRYRWYHYKFCKGRALVFSTQDYLDEWENSIRERLQKYPGQIIPSHGLKAVLNRMQSRQFQKVVAFLESEDVDRGIDIFIQDLKSPENDVPINNKSQETEAQSNLSDSSDKIHTRTYVIALNIYYQLRNRENEYYPLTHSPAEYEEELGFHFQVKNFSTSLYKVIRFDYRKVLNDPENKGRNQLKKQFEQIINTPEVFNKEIIKRAKEIYEKHLIKDR